MTLKYAYKEHVVTDQGNGGAYCSNCLTNLDGVFDICPNCKLMLKDTPILGYGWGGSDF